MKRIMLMFLFISLQIYGTFELAPPIQEINLKTRRSGEVFVMNQSDKPVRVKIYSRRPDDQKNEELYMGDWMIIYPQLLYLKPKSKRSVRYGVRMPQDLKDGEYRGEIVFEQLSSKNLNTDITGEITEAESKIGLEMLSIIVSTVYGNYGEIKREAELTNFKVKSTSEGRSIEGIIVNKGTGAIDPVIIINYLNGRGKELKKEEDSSRKIMRENQGEYSHTLTEIPKKAERILIEIFHIMSGDEDTERIKVGETTISI